MFTALHQYLGKKPGPVSDDLLDEAVAAGLAEASDLDWKRELPPAKNAGSSDFPKDVAAMANAGGGTIVYGVAEQQKMATGRIDVGELTEIHERALHSAAVTTITPPIFGLKFHRIGNEGSRAVVLVVPPSVDGPHLIYRNDYFGAPVRNDADTVWMRERQIEAMYRARFDERRHATDALDSLYAEAATSHDLTERAWFVGVVHPRLPALAGPRPEREQAAALFEQAGRTSLRWADRRSGMHPLEYVDRSAPRPGLRRWIAPNTAASERLRFRQAWASIHHDGSVTLAAAVGGPPKSFDEGTWPGWRIAATSIECAISDLAGLLNAVTAARGGSSEYEVKVGIEYRGNEPMVIQTKDGMGLEYDESSTPLERFTPVTVTFVAGEGPDDLHRQAFDLAQDCVNQGGVSYLHAMSKPTQ